MKLKTLIAATLIATSMSASAVQITLSPLATAINLVRSAAATVVSPVISTEASTIASSAQSRSRLLAVKEDAVDFLAGQREASDALKATITDLRAADSKLESLSDVELASAIVVGLN